MALGNTTQRIIVAIIAIPLIAAACLFGKYLFFGFTTVIALLSFYEFHQMAKVKRGNANLILGLISIALIVVNQYFKFADFEFLILTIITLHLILELFRNKGSEINNLGASFVGLFYIGMFAASLIGIREIYAQDSPYYDQGGLIILGLLLTIWVCDSAAFFLGVAFGKHKIFPRISPKKSWEGSIAGFLFALLTMVANKWLFMNFLTWENVIVIGFIVGVFGQIGDFVESMIKRDSGVKDSSALIPGHGGIFDRFDSLLFTAPFVYLYLSFFTI